MKFAKDVKPAHNHREEVASLVESGDYNLAEFRAAYKAKWGTDTNMTDDQLIDFLCIAEADDPLDESERGQVMRDFETQVLGFEFAAA